MKILQMNRDRRGFAMILIMIILIVATGIGIWGLSNSRTNIQKAGSRRAATTLTYQAEQGLQMAVRRFQGMCQNPSVDQVSITNATDSSAGKTGGNYAIKDIMFLLNVCQESFCGLASNPCPAFDYLKDYDIFVGPNVDCNFLGVIAPGTQVAVVRKNDIPNPNDPTGAFAIYLINSVSMDKSGHKQGIQGVVTVPYDLAATPSVCTAPPYLVSSKAITD